jgi:hypothetical protein
MSVFIHDTYIIWPEVIGVVVLLTIVAGLVWMFSSGRHDD